VALALAYLSPYFDPNEYWIFSMFGVFYPVLLLANIFMVLFWMGVEFKYLFLSLIAVVVGWSHLKGFVNFSTLSKEPGDLTVMSYNISFFYNERVGGKKEEDNLKNVKSFFAKHNDVDVFSLQESNKYCRDLLKEMKPDFYGHEIGNKGTYILSRYPIIDNGKIEFGTKTNSCLWADIRHPAEVVRIYSMHLHSNKVSKDAVDVIDNVNIQEKETWNGIRGILSKYSTASKRRAKQATLISEHAKNSPYKNFITGDVNDPPTSFTYSRLCGDYKDSFVEAGAGIGTTYAGRIPMLRIDYIFTDPAIDVESFEILKVDYSDHYPVKGVYSFINEDE